ncbi:MAG: PIG-L deacetylase family protein [Candidatus Omnitrophota bacterium]|nr:PIG-L deacetylase family protein [Candidatus Omnitrophota bacterium]
MNILIIAPHMDDEVLGCGGTIARHIGEKDNVFVSFIANRVYNHHFDRAKNEIERQHAIKAKDALGYRELVFFDLNDERLDASIQDIIILLEKYVNKIKPSVVYIPFLNDNNQDHRAVFDAARVVLRSIATPFINSIYMYEVPSSTDQSPPLPENIFLPNYYVDIAKYIDKKIKAFKCYETEKRAYPHPRSKEALKVLAKKRGIEIGFKYAEAFMVIRKKWRA